MLKKVLLDNQEMQLRQSDLPILIHGEEGSGASLFTMTLLGEFYFQGLNVVALTGFSMASKKFVELTGEHDNVHFFTKEESDAFIKFVNKITHLSDYILLIKNIELINEETFESVRDFNNVIISGDINKCSYKENLSQMAFNAKIYFSPLSEALPEIKKYQGLLVSENRRGIISLES